MPNILQCRVLRKNIKVLVEDEIFEEVEDYVEEVELFENFEDLKNYLVNSVENGDGVKIKLDFIEGENLDKGQIKKVKSKVIFFI